MAAALLFGLILCGCLFLSAVFHRRFEEGAPLSAFAMIVVLYGFGLAGALRAGVYAVLGLCGAAAAAGLVIAAKQGRVRRLAGDVCTPALVLYAVWCAIVCFANAGKPVHTWDEFTYWADAVKIMTQQGVLPSDPAARCLFASYPPALPLWEYLLQALGGLINPKAAFSEPMLFIAYQWLMLALYLPFLRHVSFRRPLEMAAHAVLVPLAAMAVFPLAFDLLHSDALLGTLAGFVCAYALLERRRDGLFLATMCAALFVVTLTKDAGLVFALAGVAALWLCGAWDAKRAGEAAKFTGGGYAFSPSLRSGRPGKLEPAHGFDERDGAGNLLKSHFAGCAAGALAQNHAAQFPL
ncbi:MAG: hypothetical protein MRZ54_10970 [Clostridiales bacterium]|nr:hypothetical protein [Clostridiales bacterium]